MVILAKIISRNQTTSSFCFVFDLVILIFLKKIKEIEKVDRVALFGDFWLALNKKHILVIGCCYENEGTLLKFNYILDLVCR